MTQVIIAIFALRENQLAIDNMKKNHPVISHLEKTKPMLVTVTALHAGQRIDNFLARYSKGLPKSHLYRILRKGEVRVNKKRIKPDYRVQAGDVVRVPPMRLATPASKVTALPSHLEELLKSRILYEDKGLLIINKPAGMAVHGGSGINLGLIEALRFMYPQETALELAHRLDRDTSGCLLLAKKPSLLKEIHELLRKGGVDKRYLALVKGYWPKHLHVVDAALKKFELQSGERMVKVDDAGKPSQTEFRVIQRFADTTLVEAKLLTGRTHQIRVHGMHVGHPLVGDEKYGDKDFNKLCRGQGCKRLFLHASSVSFTLPSYGKTITAQAPLEADLENCLQILASSI